MPHKKTSSQKEYYHEEYEGLNNIYEVIEVDSNTYKIKAENSSVYDAELAISCVVIPRVDDIVTIATYNNTIFITSIIKSYNIEPREFHLKGLVKAGLEESYINIDAQNIRIETKKINLISKFLISVTNISKWFSTSTSVNSKSIKQSSDYNKIKCKQTLTIDAKNNKTHTK